MDSASVEVPHALPPEFASVMTASTSFFKVGNAIDQLYDDEAVKKHIITATSLGHLIEFKEGQVMRSTKISWKDISKIVVHHHFHPLQLCILALRRCQKVALISYSDLSILYTWDEVEDVASSDLENSGVPTLVLKLVSGEKQLIPNKKLLCLSGNDKPKEAERGKDDAAIALAHRLKGGINHVEKLSSERQMKENYISQKLKVLQSKLEGSSVPELKNLSRTLAVGNSDIDRSCPERIPPPKLPEPPLQMLSTRHKIVHNKWIIGINVLNKADRFLVFNPQLCLHVSTGTGSIFYTTEILRTVQRRQVNPTDGDESSKVKVTIEKLNPPILRPQKRACILGICEVPSFCKGPSVTCMGMVTYTCKPLSMEVTQDLVPSEASPQIYQVSIDPVVICAHELQTHVVTVELGTIKGGMPFNIVALIAGSRCNHITLTSIVSPIFDLISRISKKYSVVKIGSVSGMYCFYPKEHHPLHLAVFSLQTLDAHKVDITLYTKDDNQALLLLHSVLAVLPPDVNIQPTGSSMRSSNSQTEKIRHQLLAKMKEVTSSVIEGFETSIKARKRTEDEDEIMIIENDNRARLKNSPKSNRQGTQDMSRDQVNSKRYLDDREVFLAGKGDVTFEAEVYEMWRKRLYGLHCEMDSLHVQYLELN